MAETALRPPRGLAAEAAAAGFAIERVVVEAEGLCARCREAAGVRVLIEAQGLGMRFGGQRVLADVTLTLRAGEIVTVVGPNGSGKSTLLRLLIGAERPDAGRVVRAPGLRIGYVPQRLAVDRTLPLTVDGFLGLAGGGRAARAEALERVGIAGLGGSGSSRRCRAGSSSGRCWRRRCCGGPTCWCSTRRRRGSTRPARRASTG